MDKGLINIIGVLSIGKCQTCWCSEECDSVGGETMCGLLRTYYIKNI